VASVRTLIENELTRPQLKTLREIQKFIELAGYPPTVEELSKRLRLTKATVHGSLDRLMQKGYVRRTPNKARSLEIVRRLAASVIDVVAVPLLGDVPAGVPVSLEEHQSGVIYVEANVTGREPCFALNVVGDSMVGADIRDRDIVIVRQQPLAEHGEIVVAAIDGEVTVKRLAINEGRIRLLPENSKYKPIDVQADGDLRILGRVIATRRIVAPT
jgi:repressor LexA